ncbi:MAG: pirin family protein [Sandaracinaceae bacterium]|nr:pirin family protein [Sandaracinaceae bacterium]
MTVLDVLPLGFPWVTFDPFLFCVHHDDAYPAGNDAMGPAASLAGRDLGMDFEVRDGWRMYHGDVVPGFPRHPHRGFETVTLARNGYIDHSDSLGAAARFGHGDAQWMTAGSGVVHSEMFPLVKTDAPNPTELFQIWLNLAPEDKLVDPHFTMLWDRDIPKVTLGEDGPKTRIAVVAGQLAGQLAPPPPPKSWAARADSDVAIWTLRMEPNAHVTLPPARPGSHRTLYFFLGAEVDVAGTVVREPRAIRVRADVELPIQNGDAPGELLLLQGRPIGAPVAHYGPFVMNTRAELQQAFADYQRTGFGGWPWDRDDPVHPRDQTRFARHADGHEDRIEE